MYTKNIPVTQFIPETLARISGGDGHAYRNLLGDSLLSGTVSGSALVRVQRGFKVTDGFQAHRKAVFLKHRHPY